MTSTEIRKLFLDFFEKNGHKVVASSSLIPKLDPTLLFTNAGMNQFKGVFTGEEKRDYKRATSSQKCVRAGGKHNDLENVGRTARHHTFFEMLGNFSFGDYFKKEAISFAWKFVTEELKLSKDRLYVSVFKDDNEAFQIWNKGIKIDSKRIYKFGEKDNFWAMGETGPCGPCSEIFFDQGKDVGCGKSTCDVGCECDRYLEFWNLVFMEFEQLADGSRVKLPKPSIDTGSGLERVAAIVQGVQSNYDTDLFSSIFKKLGEMIGKKYETAQGEEKVSMCVVADHIRWMTFLISDGVQPSNEGRGYVLRRIMRRAMRHGKKLGLEKPFLCKLSQTVVDEMGKAYLDLKSTAKSTAEIIELEEKRFSETIDRGLSLLEEEMSKLKQKNETVLSGTVAFHLYDTYGFPVDLTADMLREHDMTYDVAGFEAAFEIHREKARGSWKGSKANVLDSIIKNLVDQKFETKFLGYDTIIVDGKIDQIIKGGLSIESAQEGDEIEVIAKETPFYGESGGQVGDIGSIYGNGFVLDVVDTKKPAPSIMVHKCKVREGKVKKGPATFQVDAKARLSTAKNHTATHMLHATLKEVLGSHVKQAGSLVSPERLRFDFNHIKGLTTQETHTIEKKMNERIWLDSQVQKKEMPLEQALASGAVALFDEKYGNSVRVLTIADYSMELCGGTHLGRTGEIGIFKILKESSVAAGVRRIEAITGDKALQFIQDSDQKLKQLASQLGTTQDGLDDRIEKLLAKQQENKNKKTITNVEGTEKVENISGISFLQLLLNDVDQKEIREIADRHMEKMKSGVVVLGTQSDGKAFLVVKVSKDLTTKANAGKLVQEAAKILGGSGGGRPDMAQAGGPQIEKLTEALTAVRQSLLNLS